MSWEGGLRVDWRGGWRCGLRAMADDHIVTMKIEQEKAQQYTRPEKCPRNKKPVWLPFISIPALLIAPVRGKSQTQPSVKPRSQP